jgi:ubiquinone/menaquinone biosynthesis C-methylase UbiE
MKVLDLGCGPGRLTVPIAERLGRHGEVVAVDIQAGMLRRAEAKAQAARLTNVEFLQAAVGEGKLPHNQFDRAVLVTVLGEIVDREAALREVFDSLKPGGFLSVTETVLDPHFQSCGAVRRLTTAAGFVEKAFYGSRFAFTLNAEKAKSG